MTDPVWYIALGTVGGAAVMALLCLGLIKALLLHARRQRRWIKELEEELRAYRSVGV